MNKVSDIERCIESARYNGRSYTAAAAEEELAALLQPQYVRPTDNFNTQVDEIMCWFNFGKVYNTMVATDWIWVGSDTRNPSIGEIRTHALKLLRDLVDRVRLDKEYKSISTGGFVAAHNDGILSLTFAVDSWEYQGD